MALRDLLICRSLSCPEIGRGCPFLMLVEMVPAGNIYSLKDFFIKSS
jgi:hypothetical protein